MIRRHPHVFGSVHASSANEVLDIWDKVKTGERNAANESLLNNAANKSLLDKEAKPEGLLDSVPVSFRTHAGEQDIAQGSVGGF